MTKIKTLKPCVIEGSVWPAGATVEISEDGAKAAIAAGDAEAVEASTEATEATDVAETRTSKKSR